MDETDSGSCPQASSGIMDDESHAATICVSFLVLF
jgi:hypothetical protein